VNECVISINREDRSIDGGPFETHPITSHRFVMKPNGLVMNPKQDLYTVLGLNRSASPEEIKKSYKQLALKHHPVCSMFLMQCDPMRRRTYMMIVLLGGASAICMLGQACWLRTVG
jgi:hypothetical protein